MGSRGASVAADVDSEIRGIPESRAAACIEEAGMSRLGRWLTVTAVMAGVATGAAAGESDTFITVYLQQTFPKQTNTNQQIEQINDMFGVSFDTWDDIANLSLGGHYFWQVAPRWKIGVEFDYSRGGIDGRATVDTEAGPATLAFEQKYSIYTDVLAVTQFLPCPDCRLVVPFCLAAVGVAYEKDTTELTLRNDYIDERLRVENDGFFPMYTVGVGIDAYVFGSPDWYVEVGGSYTWARLDHMVEAEGSLAPAPEVRADQDSTGPTWWIGVGKRF